MFQNHDFDGRLMGIRAFGQRKREHGRVLVGEGLVLREAEMGVEGEGAREVGDGEVNEDGLLVGRHVGVGDVDVSS